MTWKLSRATRAKWPKPCEYCGEEVRSGPFYFRNVTHYGLRSSELAHSRCHHAANGAEPMSNYDRDTSSADGDARPSPARVEEIVIAELVKIREAVERMADLSDDVRNALKDGIVEALEREEE